MSTGNFSKSSLCQAHSQGSPSPFPGCPLVETSAKDKIDPEWAGTSILVSLHRITLNNGRSGAQTSLVVSQDPAYTHVPRHSQSACHTIPVHDTANACLSCYLTKSWSSFKTRLSYESDCELDRNPKAVRGCLLLGHVHTSHSLSCAIVQK